MIIPVILCGGIGSRLWPISHQARPKPFFYNGETLNFFQQTILRFANNSNFTAPIIIGSSHNQAMICSNLAEINISPLAILLEPLRRDTAASIAVVACHVIELQLGDLPLLITPADHYVEQTDDLIENIIASQTLTAQGLLVSFVTTITSNEFGFGYVEQGAALSPGAYTIKNFIEKPDCLQAEQLRQSSLHFWNSGILMGKAECFLGELRLYEASIIGCCQRTLQHSTYQNNFVYLDAGHYKLCNAKSIERAIMEYTKIAAMVQVSMNWHDMGSLEAIYNNAPKDEQGNSLLGNVIALQSTGSYVSSEAQATAIIGLSDVIVINTIAGVVVAHADYAAQLETGLQHAALNFAEIAVTVHKTYRPWGHYVDLAKNMTMRIKHIYVNPYCRLSLQYHNKRQEYWIVLVGTATITLGTESYDLKIGESVHIPMAATHRLHNQTEEMLEVIEVQIGEDLSDDDIIRLEDDYNRV